MEDNKNRFQKIFVGLFALGFIAVCLISALFIYKYFKNADLEDFALTVRNTEQQADSTDQGETDEEIATAAVPIDDPATANLQILEDEVIPQRDPLELALRLKGITTPRAQLSEPPQIYENGAVRSFWVLDLYGNSYRQIDAYLAYQTDHLYFWIEDDVAYDQDAVVQLATIFESHIYPTDRELFGSEWTPGVDNDEHLVIVFARQLGEAAGYFSSTDSFTHEVKTFSNQAEMFYLSADYLNLEDSYTYSVLAHEFQHMIHWHQDRNETSWLNEGLSELAVDINGYETGGFDSLFSFDPDLQLTFWPGDDQGGSSANYGSSYLFVRYLYSQFGEQMIKDVVSSPANGMTSIDEILQDYIGALDTDNSAPLGDQVFQNWTIANYLQAPDINNGIYGYGNFNNLPYFAAREAVDCDSDWTDATVSQYGTDYISVDCSGNFEIEIEADGIVELFSVAPYSGEHYFWSNYGDESHMLLHREFDLSEVSGPITLSYWTWFDLERDYDYVYVTASTDGDEWVILDSPGCTSEDPTGANYGCGYNGLSSGWIQETVDLSDFAGEEVTIQFEYITDASVNGEGLVIDDISLDAIGYFTDFEEDDGGWQGEGFVRVSNQLPQSFAAALIQAGDEITVDKWISASDFRTSIQVENSNDQDEIILAISGLTRYTRLPANYRYRVRRIE